LSFPFQNFVGDILGLPFPMPVCGVL